MESTGIKIISNEDTIDGSIEDENDLWETIDGDNDEE